ncbi:hypothetical protein [Xylella fastidiosa]|uniref:hypothetical protein n=1 Tax=Xylella fastidiosa TaxID=2371 RepID=UPI000FFF57EC|nr:hypothetical protein [Xylella fastidiosa]RWA36998.1 hypothetical protein XfCFBP8078_10030 [Xylella fastidiosa subsp. multiplex]
MRNVWMIVSGFVVFVAIGGSVYYFFSKKPVTTTFNVQELPSIDNHVLKAPTGNPLLTANIGQFDRWVPLYPIQCGEIVFDRADPNALNFSFCIDQIKKRVALGTGYQLSSDDVLDPRVKAHWHEVMRAK